MKAALPTLSSSQNYLTDDRSIMNKLYEYFVTSEWSQSNTYRDKIASLKYIAASGNNSIRTMEENIKQSLRILYVNYFSEVEIEVQVIESEETSKVSYVINIIAKTKTGSTLSLDKTLTLENNVINYNTLLANLMAQ